jgi:transcriptional regulator with XRE-family HTH domain
MKGGRLKQARETMHLKQEDMADKLNIGQSAYSKMERGKSDFSNELLILIPELGINLNWIITGKGEMFLTNTPASDPENDLTGELEERIRRIKIDVSDIEDTVRRLIQKRK